MIKILVLDDEKGLCEQMKDFFSYRGYKIFTTISGEQAMALIKKEKPDILLLDIRMEGTIDGLGVLKQAKEKDPKVKVIMITAIKDEDTKRQAFSLGASEYITKPFSYDNLETIITHTVNAILREREGAPK